MVVLTDLIIRFHITRIDNVNYLFIPATCILDNIFDILFWVGDLRNVVYDEDNLGQRIICFQRI